MARLYNNFITSTPGPRSSPGGIGSTNHQGWDIVADGRGLGLTLGADIGVTGGGTWEVIHAGPEGGYGNSVWIENTVTGEQRQFAHLDTIGVQEGQVFTAPDSGVGFSVGTAGSSGNSTGPHLHYATYDANGNLIRDPSATGNVTLSKGLEQGGGSTSQFVNSDPITPAAGTIPSTFSDAGYTQTFVDEGRTYYYNPTTNTSYGVDPTDGQVKTFNADTGEALGAGNLGSTSALDAAPQTAAPTAASAAGLAGGAQQLGQQGQQIGGAGCKGGGPSPAKMLGAGGLMGNLGGLAQGALMGGAMAALGGAGIQGIMGAAMGSAAGALGNALGAAAGGAVGAFAGQALGGALGAVVAGGNPLQALTGSAFGALSQMGASLIPSLSSVMPPEIASAAVSGLTGALGALARGAPAGAAAQFALAGGLNGAISSYIGNMTGNFALGSVLGQVASGALNGTLPVLNSAGSGRQDLSRFARNIGAAAAAASENRIMVGAIAEGMSLKFGNTVGGYGAKVRNMQDAMTFSVTTLGQDVKAIAADFIALGDWKVTNLMRFMQPGNVAQQILDRGLGEITGLTDALLNLQAPIAGLDNPIFDRITQQALNSITDRDAIKTIQGAFGMTVFFNNLGALTNLQLMMPTSSKNMPVKNMRELGVQLAIIGIGENTTIKKIGLAFNKIETSTDLNHISQQPTPLPEEVGAQLMQIYGYGGGTYGEQTMADFMGTVAGYVHTDTIPVIVETTNFISNHAEAARLNELSKLLKETLSGDYTDLGSPGDPAQGIPEDSGGIDVPTVGSFSSLDDAVLAFIPLIEAEQQALLNTSDELLADAIKKLEVAYRASCAQLVRESNNLTIHNIDLFDETPGEPMDAVMFMDNLDQWALQTGYGEPGEFIERVASDDVYGDSIKYAMRQARNARALEELGIDIEQHKLPQSEYYRSPESFYQKLYTGSMPPRPQYQQSLMFPKTPADVYLTGRNAKLTELGYEQDLLANQMDEIYYDSFWMDTDQMTLESIGRQVVRRAIDSTISIKGTDMYITGLDNIPVKFGEIKPNGLLLTNNDYFTTTLLNVVNRLLYGRLVTSKYENPFMTDQMIFGVLELLAQITNQNIEALAKTVTGGLIAGNLLEQLMNIYGINRSLFDTAPNRNDPVAWGAAGPEAEPE